MHRDPVVRQLPSGGLVVGIERRERFVGHQRRLWLERVVGLFRLERLLRVERIPRGVIASDGKTKARSERSHLSDRASTLAACFSER